VRDPDPRTPDRLRPDVLTASGGATPCKRAGDRRIFVAAAIGFCAALWTYACEDGTTEPPQYLPEPATITVSPATAELAVPGSTVRMTAQVLDENGQPITGVEIVWAVDDRTVAVVDASGLVTGIVDGTATVTATVGGMTGAATVMVAMGSAATDRTALVALYEATDGPNWLNNDNWLTDAPLGEWYGVQTDGSGRVTWLGLYGNDLAGPIPPELGNLADLPVLDLGHNALTGPIPSELGSLSNLTVLSLQDNALTGPIPPELDTGCPK